MSLGAIALDALSRELRAEASLVGLDRLRPRAQRRAQGAFFTPMPLVRFLVEEALDAWLATHTLAWDASGAPKIRILDPAAGDGRFLVCAKESLLRRLRGTSEARSSDDAALARQIQKNCLVAIERDPDYVTGMRRALGEGAVVHCQEALLSGVVADGSVDVVLGNPPYLRSIQLGQVDEALRSRLRGAYAATSYREWDVYAAFLEQGMRWLRQSGQLAFVLPSRWWTAQWASPMRKALCEQGAVRALVDFGAAQLFESATVYASICFASTQASPSLQMARYLDGVWETGAIHTSELGLGEPWNLSVGPSRALLQDLSARGPSLGTVARIAKGTGTNADGVFVIPDAAKGIEAALLRPLLRGRDVVAGAEAPTWPRLLVPYDNAAQLIPPKKLAVTYPRAWAHLLAHRERLEAREKGRFAGETFYRFGRPQNLAFHSDSRRKVVVPDVTKAGRALIDSQSAMVLDSAYAIRSSDGSGYDLECICAVLNSKMVHLWLGQHGLPLRGGYTRMKSAYLKGLPLPPQGERLDRVSEAVRQGTQASDLDELVRLAYGVDLRMWR